MDRITQVGIENVRAIEQLELELARPITVLIGENGSCKSTILECLELLRKAGDPSFLSQLYGLHRGLPGLLRKGATELSLGVRVEEDGPGGPPLDYQFTLRATGAGAVVASESLQNARDGFLIIDGAGGRTRVYDATSRVVRQLDPQPSGLALTSFGAAPPDPRMGRVVQALRGIEVHVPFDTRASWVARTYQRPESIRAASTLFPAERLNLLGVNLANAWSELLAQPTRERERALALLRLGLGERLDTVVIEPDMGGGDVHLALRFTDLAEPIFAVDLSDGQLAWLGFVALASLDQGRSLLAVDEPERHLHPSLLGRAVSLLANLPGGAPVVMSTHSDRVLELLEEPAEAVRVCVLEGSRAEVRRIDPAELPRWLEQFGDLGQLRAAGYLPRVLEPSEPATRPADGTV